MTTSAWTIVPTPNLSGSSTHNELTGVATIAPTDAWAVGSATDYSPGGHALTYHWDGSAWSRVTTPSPGYSATLRAVSASPDGTVWSVGDSAADSLTLRWDGRGESGQRLAAGIYLLRAVVLGQALERRLVLLH